MSWMDNVEREFLYRCPNGHEAIVTGHDCSKEDFDCPEDGCIYLTEYQKMLPLKMGITGKISYDQNGRKAYRIHHQDGSVTHMSETKMRYLETGDMVPSYTKEYASHLAATGQGHQLQGQTLAEMKASRKATEELKKKIVPVTSAD